MPPAGPAARPGPAAAAPASDAAPPRRFVPVVRDAGPPAGPALVRSGDVVLVAGDAGSAAAALARLLAERGVRTLRAGEPSDRDTQIAALVDLRPLTTTGDVLADDVGRSRARVGGLVTGLLDLCRTAGPGLRAVIAATGMGGTFGVDACAGAPLDPAHGALAGLVKAVGAEWPHVAAKVVDFEAGCAGDTVAQALLAELLAHDGHAEVGRPPGRRVTIGVAPAPVAGPSGTVLGPESVVLLTGGARGITGAAARALAARFGSTLVLVGRTPLDGDDPRAREVRATLDAIAAAGGRAEYVQADAGDHDRLAGVVEAVRRRHGRLDGVIHGAGVIDDGALTTKTPASVARVLDPKVTGALTLARRLPWDGLRFLVLFSSVSGRFGNAGQTDYAAANEFLSKLAADLDRRRDARVVAIAWGPWTGAGMVSDAVARRFAQRGVELIDAAAGCAALIDEIERSGPALPEVVVGGGPWAADAEAPPPAAAPEPLMPAATGAAGAVEARIVLDPASAPLLDDHRLDGRPVLPAALALEMLAETAATALGSPCPSIRLDDFRLLRGITAEDGELALLARSVASDGGVTVELADAAAGLVHYRARGSRDDGAQPPEPPAPLSPSAAFPLSVDEIYTRWLWHGPSLQAIVSIDAHAPEGLDATLRASAAPAGAWRLDPVVVDAVFQLGIVWSRHALQRTALPARVGRIQGTIDRPPGTAVHCRLRLRAQPGGALLTGRAAVLDDAGRPLAVLDGIELSCSAELNRLGGARAGREAIR